MKNKAGIKRKLMTDRQLPTPDQVNSRQNFNKVSNNYALIKKVMFRNMLAWGGGIIGAAAITSVVDGAPGRMATVVRRPLAAS